MLLSLKNEQSLQREQVCCFSEDSHSVTRVSSSMQHWDGNKWDSTSLQKGCGRFSNMLSWCPYKTPLPFEKFTLQPFPSKQKESVSFLWHHLSHISTFKSCGFTDHKWSRDVTWVDLFFSEWHFKRDHLIVRKEKKKWIKWLMNWFVN